MLAAYSGGNPIQHLVSGESDIAFAFQLQLRIPHAKQQAAGCVPSSSPPPMPICKGSCREDGDCRIA